MLYSVLTDSHKYWVVMPLSIMRLYQSLSGNITFTKEVATINFKDSPPILFRLFADRDIEVAEKEAIDWFENNKLDISNVDNWLI